MEYDFRTIEQKWQDYWEKNKTWKTDTDSSKPKYYVLDMFPYPSGAGLHVGHPLGYIASDIFSRYMRHKGYNVLHPMGYDAFGLPAEQYAIQTGQHPALTTEQNIERYREQLDKIGFSFDWDREVRTSDPEYYKWTQWAFIQMFNSYYDNKLQKAAPIEQLVKAFETAGTKNTAAACTEPLNFTDKEWNAKTGEEEQEILLNYRLAYLADTMVNWCPALGTVLANDEVVNGYSERGGHPVEQKKMKQWCLRVSAYAERLLEGLERIDWSESLKEIQRNWIGRSEGADIVFRVQNSEVEFTIFTTRPDTIYGCTFMVLAPESDLVEQVTVKEKKQQVQKYIEDAKKRNERERLADTKTVTGVFTGACAEHPFTKEPLQIWVSDYVLAGYGTGAIMAVPAHDSRDFVFAKHFNLPITQVVKNKEEEPSNPKDWEESYDAKEGVIINSDIINGLEVPDAIQKITREMEKQGLGKKQINYRLRDAIFSRQRYWGEPFPVYYKDGLPYPLDENKLPLELPEVDKYEPTPEGKPPLARAKNWKTKEGYPLEINTMPGFAGSSAYYLRYMDPRNDTALVSKETNEYWRDVDLYIGGAEHATGHLIYARFWNKFLFDSGYVCEDEPFKKLINQGMIQGRSSLVHRINEFPNLYVSNGFQDVLWEDPKMGREKLQEAVNKQAGTDINITTFTTIDSIRIPIEVVENDILNEEKLKKIDTQYKDAIFIKEEDGNYHCGYLVEKMSKRYRNVVNPDNITEQYGADTLRMYEMFLGPLEISKPWDTNGIEGVHKFLRKTWRLFHDDKNKLNLCDDKPEDKAQKTIHKTIKKVREDIERYSFNTAVSAFMICVNELTDQKCNNREILEKLLVLLSPFAPHICEELWEKAGHQTSIAGAEIPDYDEKYLVEDTFEYPVSFNGKMRFKLELDTDLSDKQIKEAVLNDERAEKWTAGKTPKKVIIVPKRIINIVV